MHVLIRALSATAASFLGAKIWTKCISHLVKSRRLTPHAARKIMHVTTAPLFAATFPLYPNHFLSSFLAACVPFSFAIRMALHPEKDTLVRTVAREKSNDLDIVSLQKHAQGPIAYAISMSAVTVFFWRDSACTYITMAALCFGDGMADVIGSYFNAWPLPLPRFCTKRKTLPGSIAFITSTFLSAISFLKVASLGGVKPVSNIIIAKLAVAGGLVEILPIEDNISVPLVVSALCQLLN